MELEKSETKNIMRQRIADLQNQLKEELKPLLHLGLGFVRLSNGVYLRDTRLLLHR